MLNLEGLLYLLKYNNAMEYVFVYGTLMRNFTNHMSEYVKQHSEFYSNGYFYGALYNIGTYPAAILGSVPTQKVYGEIVCVTNIDSFFSIIDEYEEVGEMFLQPNEYIRKKIPVYLNSGEQLEAWVYLYNHSLDSAEQIPSGNYYDVLN